MPVPLPPKPLGIFLGASTCDHTLDVFIDPCCPFSKKIFKTLLDVHRWAESTKPGSFRVKFFLAPQPWHPQSSILVEAGIAVQMIDENKVIPYLDRFFDQSENFYDKFAYDKSRSQLYDELATIAEEFVSKEEFLRLLAFKPVEGQLNSGNETTQTVKWLVKYHRSCGVHVTPTCFFNNIEAGHISSGWTLAEWQEFLVPFFG